MPFSIRSHRCVYSGRFTLRLHRYGLFHHNNQGLLVDICKGNTIWRPIILLTGQGFISNNTRDSHSLSLHSSSLLFLVYYFQFISIPDVLLWSSLFFCFHLCNILHQVSFYSVPTGFLQKKEKKKKEEDYIQARTPIQISVFSEMLVSIFQSVLKLRIIISLTTYRFSMKRVQPSNSNNYFKFSIILSVCNYIKIIRFKQYIHSKFSISCSVQKCTASRRLSNLSWTVRLKLPRF